MGGGWKRGRGIASRCVGVWWFPSEGSWGGRVNLLATPLMPQVRGHERGTRTRRGIASKKLCGRAFEPGVVGFVVVEQTHHVVDGPSDLGFAGVGFGAGAGLDVAG